MFSFTQSLLEKRWSSGWLTSVSTCATCGMFTGRLQWSSSSEPRAQATGERPYKHVQWWGGPPTFPRPAWQPKALAKATGFSAFVPSNFQEMDGSRWSMMEPRTNPQKIADRIDLRLKLFQKPQGSSQDDLIYPDPKCESWIRNTCWRRDWPNWRPTELIQFQFNILQFRICDYHLAVSL